MKQDRMDDNRIKNLFNSMELEDANEAQARKEAIWQSLDLKSKDKSGYKWLVLLLMSILFFLSGWMVNNLIDGRKSDTNEIKVSKPIVESEHVKLDELRNLLSRREQQFDSLMMAYGELSVQLQNIQKTTPQIITEIRTTTDTIYQTRVKVEQKLVERIVRDTILIEIPVTPALESVMAEAEETDPTTSAGKSKPSSHSTATSIQFNFEPTRRLKK